MALTTFLLLTGFTVSVSVGVYILLKRLGF